MLTPNAELPISVEFLDQILRPILCLPHDVVIVGAIGRPREVRLLVTVGRLPQIEDGKARHVVVPSFEKTVDAVTGVEAVKLLTLGERLNGAALSDSDEWIIADAVRGWFNTTPQPTLAELVRSAFVARDNQRAAAVG